MKQALKTILVLTALSIRDIVLVDVLDLALQEVCVKHRFKRAVLPFGVLGTHAAPFPPCC